MQQNSVKIDPVYGCMNAKLSGADNIKKPISFSKSPLLLTFCTGAATDEGFLVAIDCKPHIVLFACVIPLMPIVHPPSKLPTESLENSSHLHARGDQSSFEHFGRFINRSQ